MCHDIQAHWVDGVSRIVSGFREEETYHEFDCNNCVAENREQDANMYDMMLREFKKYIDIVAIDRYNLLLYSSENNVHCALKSARSVT